MDVHRTVGCDSTPTPSNPNPNTTPPPKKQQVKLPAHILAAHCSSSHDAPLSPLPPHTRDPFWESLRRRGRRLLRRRWLSSVQHEDAAVEESLQGLFSGVRPLMAWATLSGHLLCLGLAAGLYCYGYLDEKVGRACLAAVGMGGLLWVAGRLGHEGTWVWVCGGGMYVCV